MTQHASLSPERWAAFGRDQQLLMIANEMNRASSMSGPSDLARFRRCYERVLRLVDLTVEVNASRALRRELLRWRELAAAIFISPAPSAGEHRALFRALLLLTPATARQIPFVLG
jgi:pantothenate kinase